MKASALFLGLLVPTAISAVTPCLNEEYDEDVFNIPSTISRRTTPYNRAQTPITVDLWVHLILSAPLGDNATDTFNGVAAQASYLNSHYLPWGFQFNLQPITYVVNAEWASSIDADKDEKLKQLHRGDYKSVNLYLVQEGDSGVCSFPDWTNDPVNQTTLDGDGCLVPLGTGISNSSGTPSHEIGHWFGLFHVFQGGCNGTDYCDDTAAQNEPSYGKEATLGDLGSCPAPDTCPNQPGLDNVKNFMDYTDCAQEFTSCQGARMMAVYNQYRANRTLADGVVVTKR